MTNYKKLFTSEQKAELRKVLDERYEMAAHELENGFIQAAQFDINVMDYTAYTLWTIDVYTDSQYFKFIDKVHNLQLNIYKRSKEGQ